YLRSHRSAGRVHARGRLPTHMAGRVRRSTPNILRRAQLQVSLPLATSLVIRATPQAGSARCRGTRGRFHLVGGVALAVVTKRARHFHPSVPVPSLQNDRNYLGGRRLSWSLNPLGLRASMTNQEPRQPSPRVKLTAKGTWRRNRRSKTK